MMNEEVLKQPMTQEFPKELPNSLNGDLRSKLMRWETLLMVFVAIAFFTNTQISPYFLDPWSLSDATFNFTEKAIIALPMALLILMRWLLIILWSCVRMV